MSIKEFAEVIKTALEERTGNEVRIQEVDKNNGVKLQALTIVDPDTNVTPTIYLEYYFKQYEGGAFLEDLAECIYRAYMKNKVQNTVDLNWFRDFEQVRTKVAYKLINYDKNKELLKQIPYTKVLNLARVYIVSVETEGLGRGTILIRNKHLEMWNIEPEQLEEIAEKNTPELLPAVVDTMENVLMNILDMGELEYGNYDTFPEMYVMTNPIKVFGAATMFYKDALRDLASKIDSDILILPSSVHELILLKHEPCMDYNRFKYMVYEVNRTQVADEEVLSDSVYIYHRDTDSITIA